MNAKLIKIDKNGSKHYEGMMICPRCSGAGKVVHHMVNGQPSWNWTDGGICWKCHGEGMVLGKWIERTPEYQAKLDAKRQAKIDAKVEERRKAEEERKAKEEALRKQIEAEKKISQFIGEAGQKLEIKAKYIGSPFFESVYGRTYIHQFKDENGNKIVWKSGTKPEVLSEENQMVILKGTVKEHSEYKGEKQTTMTRCKIERS